MGREVRLNLEHLGAEGTAVFLGQTEVVSPAVDVHGRTGVENFATGRTIEFLGAGVCAVDVILEISFVC